MSPSVIIVDIGKTGPGHAPGVSDATQGAGHPRMARCNKSDRRSGADLNATAGNRGIGEPCKCSKNAEWNTPGGDGCGQAAAIDYYSFDQIADRYRWNLVFRSPGGILVAKVQKPVV